MEEKKLITLDFDPSELKFIYECVGLVINGGFHPRCMKFDYIPEWLFSKLNSEGFVCEIPWESFVPERIRWNHKDEKTGL